MEEELASGRSSQLQRQRLRFQARLNCKYLCSPPPSYRVLDINTVACTEIPGRKLAILLFRIDTLENLYTAMEVERSSWETWGDELALKLTL